MAIDLRTLAAGLVLGAAAGGAALLLVPGAATRAAETLRPLARRALVGAVLTAHDMRRRAAELSEHVEDLLAEVERDLAQNRAPANDAGPDAAPPPRRPRARRAAKGAGTSPRRKNG